MSHTIPEQFKKASGQCQRKLDPAPLDDITSDGGHYKPSGKLEGRKIIITGADSGIGRSIAPLFALEGADLTLTYLPEEKEDIQEMVDLISKKTQGERVILTLECDLRKEDVCAQILNHGTQNANKYLPTLPTEQWHEVFDTNIHSFFYLTKAAVPRLEPGSSITFNASINFAVGHPELTDYTATKGAMIGFMRALSNQIVGEKGIRCNAVAPGPIWTPLVAVILRALCPATMSKESLHNFGTSVPIGRAGQPIEVATAFVYLLL
ncbi:NAD(P)-binding protein [Epithele typhae]|uniref:NAD(P)-binding protein n=1 Tax=Epithele typhae TaxID=378194 RepID=UPI0020072372|nr:NAD(P)-binding protein [Epithele typhae]KAH9944161.1 NAD(P)-binding protein [Epithele typhae]